MTDTFDFKKRDTSSRDYSKGITLHAGLIVILQFLGSRSRKPTLVKFGIPVTGVFHIFGTNIVHNFNTNLTDIYTHLKGAAVIVFVEL